VKLASLSQLQVQQPPRNTEIEDAESLDTVLPGCNVIFRDEPRRVRFDDTIRDFGTAERMGGCENLSFDL